MKPNIEYISFFQHQELFVPGMYLSLSKTYTYTLIFELLVKESLTEMRSFYRFPCKCAAAPLIATVTNTLDLPNGGYA